MAQTHTNTHKDTRKHTYIRTYIHTYIHTYIQNNVREGIKLLTSMAKDSEYEYHYISFSNVAVYSKNLDE